MTPEQVHQAAKAIFELRCSIVPDKAQASLAQRKFIRKQIELHNWRKLLDRMEKELSAISI